MYDALTRIFPFLLYDKYVIHKFIITKMRTEAVPLQEIGINLHTHATFYSDHTISMLMFRRNQGARRTSEVVQQAWNLVLDGTFPPYFKLFDETHYSLKMT